jgi:hypothetical protein
MAVPVLVQLASLGEGIALVSRFEEGRSVHTEAAFFAAGRPGRDSNPHL